MRRAVLASLLILCALFTASAGAQQNRKTGDWSVQHLDGGIQLAGTENASGNAFGVMCVASANACYAFVTLSDTKCTQGNSVPMLMNSPVGSKGMQATCTIIDSTPPLHLMILDDFDGAVGAIESGGEIGLAFPLKSGKFEVYRFSTAGAVAAVREARTPPTSKDVVPVRGAPKNQLL